MNEPIFPAAPMMREVALAHANRLINHGPTVLVSSTHQGRPNLMAAAWSMPVEFTPPRLAVVLDKSTFTCEQALASGRLAINLPCVAQVDVAYTVGSVSGRDSNADKFERYGLNHVAGPVLGLPLLLGCVAWLECRLLNEPAQAAAQVQQAYDTVFVEVVSAFADERVFSQGHWNFHAGNAVLHTLHHLGGGHFAVPSRTVQGSVLP